MDYQSDSSTLPVGVGIIPTLAAAWHLLCILSAVSRTGINPIPTADECYNAAYIHYRTGNSYIPDFSAKNIYIFNYLIMK